MDENMNKDFELNNGEDYEDVNYITQFKLTLPGRAISHNATNVSNDGKTLTWNLNDDSQEFYKIPLEAFFDTFINNL